MIRQEITSSPIQITALSENNELKNKITSWILEEGVTVKQVPDEGSEFRLQVSWGYFIDIVKLKGIPRIVSTARLSYTDENSQKSIAKLTKKDKIKIGLEVNKELTKFPIGFAINPDASYDKFESIDIHNNLYLEELTKTALFESVDLVRRALVCFNAILVNRLDIEAIETPKTSDNKGVYG